MLHSPKRMLKQPRTHFEHLSSERTRPTHTIGDWVVLISAGTVVEATDSSTVQGTDRLLPRGRTWFTLYR